jgi:hypothetical protein
LLPSIFQQGGIGIDYLAGVVAGVWLAVYALIASVAAAVAAAMSWLVNTGSGTDFLTPAGSVVVAHEVNVQAAAAQSSPSVFVFMGSWFNLANRRGFETDRFLQ